MVGFCRRHNLTAKSLIPNINSGKEITSSQKGSIVLSEVNHLTKSSKKSKYKEQVALTQLNKMYVQELK